MDAGSSSGSQPTHNPHRWYLPVTPGSATGGRLPVRRLRPRRGDRRDGGHDRARRSCGRPRSTSPTPSRRRCMDIDVTIAVPRQVDHPGRAVAHVGDTRDPHRQRRARPSRTSPIDRAVGRDARRPAARRLRPAPAAHARRRGLDHAAASTCASPSRRRGTSSPGTPRPDGRSALWARMPDCSSRRRPRWPSSATTCRSASARRSARYAGGNSLDNTLRIVPPRARPSGCCSTSGSTPCSERLRPRPRAPLGRGRHAAGHRQPVDDRAASGTPEDPGTKPSVRAQPRTSPASEETAP